MSVQFEIKFLSHHRKPKCAPNPAFPDGMDVDLTQGAKVACLANVPYPAECCGIWIVKCSKCGFTAAITAADRPDDVRTAAIPCKEKLS